MDAGHRETDKRLAELEKRIRREYRQAEKEVEEKLNKYLERFAEKDKAKRKQLSAGQITRQQYNEWRTGQIMMGQRWSEMRETLASDMVRTNEIARSMVKEFSYDAYALNHNYGTFEVEKGSRLDTSYTLYDRHTVERLMRDNPDMLPPPGKRVMENIRLGKDKLWNKQQIQSVMTQGILQGESIPQIAKRLANTVGDKDKKAAIRNARTMTTRAENYGRLDSYKRAQGMGIPVKKQWVATLDHVTRDSHVDVDGEIVDIDATFSNGLDCPGGMGPPEEVWNCRCALIAAMKGFEKDLSDTNLRRNDNLGSMTYDEWKESRKKPGVKTPAMKPH